jgi:hypothetical protein
MRHSPCTRTRGHPLSACTPCHPGIIPSTATSYPQAGTALTSPTHPPIPVAAPLPAPLLPCPTAGCPDGWTFPGAGGCVPAPAVPLGPAWARDPDHPAALTRAFSTQAEPDPATAARVPNQHESPTLRPADVAVYAVGPAGDLDAALAHLAVQAAETLHAVLFIGPVCGGEARRLSGQAADARYTHTRAHPQCPPSFNSEPVCPRELRWAGGFCECCLPLPASRFPTPTPTPHTHTHTPRLLRRGLVKALPSWSLAGTLCPRDVSGGGLAVFVHTRHRLNPDGRLLRFRHMDSSAPVHLREDMLFLRPDTHSKVGEPPCDALVGQSRARAAVLQALGRHQCYVSSRGAL